MAQNPAIGNAVPSDRGTTTPDNRGGVVGAHPASAKPAPIDLGEAAAFPENAQITLTVTLNLRNRHQLEQLIESVHTRGTPQYHQFLTTQEFRDRFGPPPEAIAAVTQHYQAAGFTVTRSGTAQLHVTGSATAIERAFGVQLHSFVEAPTPTASEHRYRAALGPVHIPPSIAAQVQGVWGLDTRAHARSAARHAKIFPKGFGNVPNTPDPPGFWTFVDVAKYYDVEPLYQRGLDGTGRIIGIVTLASFLQSDAYAYWAKFGLHVAQDRITEILVDGGSGPPSDQSGSLETAMDVEQSGGLAPAAKISVYEAPNTDQGWVDAFARAVDDNLVDTISVSWVDWEYFQATQNWVTDPVTLTTTYTLQAFDDIFAQAALQGQTVFAGAGDSGAYSANVSWLYPVPEFTPVLSVYGPADQRYVTAAGGTTLPGKQGYLLPPGWNQPIIWITLAAESVWNWEYMIPLCADYGLSPVACGIYPVGGGGGVSLYVDRPFYQTGVEGMMSTAKGQTLYDVSVTPPLLLLTLPAGFPGRNVPDLSLNADPNTGYILAYTSDGTSRGQFPPGFSFQPYWAGTSIVAPQLNGIASLMVQGLGHRIGLLNVPLYEIASQGYGGPGAPLRAITHGDNWYYSAQPGYNPASGLGVPDVANLFDWLMSHP
jgi:subtilase family serine protease